MVTYGFSCLARAIRGASCGGPCGSLVRTTSLRNQRRQLRRPLWEPGQNDQPAQSEAPVAEAPVGAWSERLARAIRGASCGGPCGSLVRTTSPRNQRRQLRRPLWEPGQNDQPAQSEAPVAEAPVGAWSERLARAIRGASCGGPCGSLVRTTSPRNQRRQLRRPLWEPGRNDQPAQSEAPVAEAPVGAWSERLEAPVAEAPVGAWSERLARAIRGASCGGPCGSLVRTTSPRNQRRQLRSPLWQRGWSERLAFKPEAPLLSSDSNCNRQHAIIGLVGDYPNHPDNPVHPRIVLQRPSCDCEWIYGFLSYGKSRKLLEGNSMSPCTCAIGGLSFVKSGIP
ncbi:hypothetical protein JB92DRAFT_3091711, partial [Gautieria morchelliformis]